MNATTAWFMIIIGTGGFAGVHLAWKTIQVRQWPTAVATIVQKDIVAASVPSGSGTGPGNRWELYIEFEYAVDGKTHVGRKYEPYPTPMRRNRAEELAASLPNRMDAYYNAANPAEAYLVTPPLFWPVAGSILGTLFLLIGIGGLASR